MTNYFIPNIIINNFSKLTKKFLAIALLFTCSVPVMAELELTISKTTNDGIPIYLANIAGGANGIIEADLKRSGRFTIVDRNKIKNLPAYGTALNAGPYTNITDYIVRGKVVNGVLEVELTSTSDNAKNIFKISSDRNDRRIAHEAADAIYEKITREKGSFDTKLAYVTVTNTTSSNREFRLFVSDADGHNSFEISKTPYLMMSPAWSPDAKKLAFVSYEEGAPAIYIRNLYTYDIQKIPTKEGSSSAPAWSPDGSHIAMSIIVDGNADIYVANLKSGQLKRLTTSSAIDTEPTWSGTKSIVFTSDRGGSGQLYRISINGGKKQRLTFDGKSNIAADIANNKLAFVKDNRHIAIRSVNSPGADRLSNGQFDDSPTLSPNGAMVAYTTMRNGENALAVISDNGKSRQFLTSPVGDIREPAWSPYLNK